MGWQAATERREGRGLRTAGDAALEALVDVLAVDDGWQRLRQRALALFAAQRDAAGASRAARATRTAAARLAPARALNTSKHTSYSSVRYGEYRQSQAKNLISQRTWTRSFDKQDIENNKSVMAVYRIYNVAQSLIG